MFYLKIQSKRSHSNSSPIVAKHDFHIQRQIIDCHSYLSSFRKFSFFFAYKIFPLSFKSFSTLKKLQFMGFFYGLTFFKLQLNQEGIQNINGVIFLSVLYLSVIYLFGTVKVSIFNRLRSLFFLTNYFFIHFLQTFPVEIRIFKREHQNGM